MAARGCSSGFDLRDSYSSCRLRRHLDLTLPLVSAPGSEAVKGGGGREGGGRVKNSAEGITKVVAGFRLPLQKNFAVNNGGAVRLVPLMPRGAYPRYTHEDVGKESVEGEKDESRGWGSSLSGDSLRLRRE